MTPQQATARIDRLNHIRHRTAFALGAVTTEGERGKVRITTLADRPTIIKWFEVVGLHAIQFDRDFREHAWVITFVEAKREGQNA